MKNNNSNNNNNFTYLLFKNVINLSSKNFSPFVFYLLNKGLNFSLPPNKIPINDIICINEFGIKDLPDNVKEVIRKDCVIVLRKAKPPKRNISKDEFLALKDLKDNLDIVILKADKGGEIIILDKSDYTNKTIDHLYNNDSYIKLNKNPIKKFNKEILTVINSINSLKPLCKKLIESNPLTPRIYGLTKIHKDGVPIRPIFNTIVGPMYLLTKFLAERFKPLVGRIDSFFKEFSSFVK